MAGKTRKIDDRILMAKSDVNSYLEVVQERINAGTISADAHLSGLRQIFSFGKEQYVGAILIVDGPIVSKESGPEAAYRYWVFVDKDWEEIDFRTITEAYKHANELVRGTIRVRQYFRAADGKFESSGTATMNLCEHQ